MPAPVHCFPVLPAGGCSPYSASNSPRRSHPSLPIRSSRFRKPQEPQTAAAQTRAGQARDARTRPRQHARPPADRYHRVHQLPGRPQGAARHSARHDLHQDAAILTIAESLHRDLITLWNTGRFDNIEWTREAGPNRLDHHLHRHRAAGGAHHQVRRAEIDHDFRSAGPVQGTPRRT